MALFIRKISRRAIVQALVAIPALALFRPERRPPEPSEELVEVNGWILKRRDLA